MPGLGWGFLTSPSSLRSCVMVPLSAVALACNVTICCRSRAMVRAASSVVARLDWLAASRASSICRRSRPMAGGLGGGDSLLLFLGEELADDGKLGVSAGGGVAGVLFGDGD